jgi:hypothetical protein
VAAETATVVVETIAAVDTLAVVIVRRRVEP